MRQQIARWARDNTDALASADPQSPVGFHNRVRANWRLLLAIAERAGGGWKSRAQRAARAIEEVHDTFDPAIGIRLLADIRIAFDACGTERVTSAVLIAELVKDEEGPWVEYGKGGKPSAQRTPGHWVRERATTGLTSRTRGNAIFLVGRFNHPPKPSRRPTRTISIACGQNKPSQPISSGRIKTELTH